MKKRLLLKLMLLAALLFLFQWGAYQLYPQWGVPNCVLLCDRFLKEKRDIIYFGDSSVFRGHENDRAGTLPQQVAALLPEYTLGDIAHDAYQPDFFSYFIDYMRYLQKAPRLIILPINLRGFAVPPGHNPAFYFPKEKAYLKTFRGWRRAFFKPMATFGLVNLDPFDTLPDTVAAGALPLHTQIEPGADEYIAPLDYLQQCYMYDLPRQHYQLQALVRIAETCEEMRVAVVYYITPVDYMLGKEQAGEEFITQLKQLIAIFKSTLTPTSATIIDLSFTLPHSDFASDTHTNVYMRDSGKAQIAPILVDAIRRSLAPQ